MSVERVTHLHYANDFEPVDLGVFGELLAQRRHGALEVLTLARVLPLDVRVEARLRRLRITSLHNSTVISVRVLT